MKENSTIGFSERSPENLEKYIELVEELQQPDSSVIPVTESQQLIDNIPFEFKTGQLKRRSRNLYLSEVERIKKEHGDLEDIRERLGLSRRKMCQKLLVDPSAWSRWVKNGAPPHVYRALEWQLTSLSQNSDSSKQISFNFHEEKYKIQELKLTIQSLAQQTTSLQKRLHIQSYITIILFLALVLLYFI